MSEDVTPEPSQQPQPSSAGGFIKGCFTLIFIGVLAIGGCTAWAMNQPKDPTREAEGMARVLCERSVKDQLKAPSTAKFDMPDISSRKVASGIEVTVRGSVDAQNSFGAMIRNRYTCEATADSKGENVRAVARIAS